MQCLLGRREGPIKGGGAPCAPGQGDPGSGGWSWPVPVYQSMSKSLRQTPTLPQGAAHPCEKQSGWGGREGPLGPAFQGEAAITAQTHSAGGAGPGHVQANLTMPDSRTVWYTDPLSCLSTSRGACGGQCFGPHVRGGREGRTCHPHLAPRVDPWCSDVAPGPLPRAPWPLEHSWIYFGRRRPQTRCQKQAGPPAGTSPGQPAGRRGGQAVGGVSAGCWARQSM